jgi:hypothetical protein
VLRVKHGVYQHNHALGPEHFKTYAENRGVASAESKAEVAAMLRHGRKRARIYEYQLERGENVVRRDVDNIAQFNAKATGDASDDDACAAALAEFVIGNVVTVDETASGYSVVISLSSSHMRDTLARFPDLILVDCTHNSNR